MEAPGRNGQPLERAACADVRGGGNYTEIDIHRGVLRGYAAYVGWVEVGRYATEQEAAERVRDAFSGPILEVR